MTGEQSVVVTGVSTGIGWAITKVLIANGFTVFGSVRQQSDADRLQREFGEAFTPLIMDVTDRQAVERAAAQVSAQLGSSNLAGLVNNAGVAVPGPLLHVPLEEYRRQLEVSPYETKDTFAIKSAQLVAHFIGLGLRPPYVGDEPVLFLRKFANSAATSSRSAVSTADRACAIWPVVGLFRN